MSEKIHHDFISAEKKMVMSPGEIRPFVRDQTILRMKEKMRNTLARLVSDPVAYLQNLREKFIIDLTESGEDIAMIEIVIQDLRDCHTLLQGYDITVPETSPLFTYLSNGLYSNSGDTAIFAMLKEAGFTFEEVAHLFKDTPDQSSSRKMENLVSLNRLARSFHNDYNAPTL
jgi:hypothetical protein